MRKTKNLPWMGRTVATAIVVLVGLGVFAGSAQAQQGADLQNYMAWWDHLTCSKAINAVNVVQINYYDSQTPVDDDTAGDHVAAVATNAIDSARWCVMSDGLSATSTQNDAKNIKDIATMGGGTTDNEVDAITRKPTDDVFNAAGWWAALDAGTNQARTRQFALGATADPGGTYSALSRANANAVDAAFAALMADAMPTDEEEEEETEDAPALPLVGVGLLGLLLAGRGAWLRRRA